MAEDRSIDDLWLRERGALHDAKILKVEKVGPDVFIFIEDEWWNSEGLPEYRGPSPGVLIARNLRADIHVAKELFAEMISEVTLTVGSAGEVLRVRLQDGYSFEIFAKNFSWRSLRSD